MKNKPDTFTRMQDINHAFIKEKYERFTSLVLQLDDSVEDRQVVEFVIILVPITKNNVRKFKTVYQHLVSIISDIPMGVQKQIGLIIKLLGEL